MEVAVHGSELRGGGGGRTISHQICSGKVSVLYIHPTIGESCCKHETGRVGEGGSW